MSESDDKTLLRPQEANLDLPDIPGYDIKGFINEGGMARVFLVEDRQLKRQAALKMIIADLEADGEFLKRFDVEGRIVAGFNHPNIVTVFASSEQGGKPYIIMEFVGGGSLADRLKGGPLAEPIAVDIARQMADALRYSHEKSIIHRDFKPANILVRDDGRPVLSDFGVAKSLTGDTTKTVAGAVIGAPKYMAPEQAMGQPVTDKSDTFAFGLVFYEMLTGEMPPKGHGVVRNAQDRQIIAKSLPQDARQHADLICDCLALEPADRPTAAECLQRLQPQVKAKASKPLMGALAATVGVVLGGMVMLYLTWDTITRDPGVAIEITPENATLYIDQRLATEHLVPSDGAAHELVVIEPKYVGQILRYDGQGEPPAIDLEPLPLPSLEEHLSFLGAYFRGAAPTAEIRNPPYRTLLDIKRASARADTDTLADLDAKVRALAKLGDDNAQLVYFIASDSGYINDSQGLAENYIVDAMREEYALATYYFAMSILDRAGPNMDPYGPEYTEFENTLKRAQSQGLNEIVEAQLNATR